MRLFVISASDAPVAAVLRRGPSDWWHVGRWELDPQAYEPGAWFRRALYPQKCDLSPDGRWLAYSALQSNATWDAGSVYEAVSRLPWLEGARRLGGGHDLHPWRALRPRRRRDLCARHTRGG